MIRLRPDPEFKFKSNIEKRQTMKGYTFETAFMKDV